ncbi:MAG: CHAT domain-containing tetratricopeptide repeat protein [Chryseolinea sp.]
MKGGRVSGVVILMFFSAGILHAQIFKDLEKAAINKAKSLNTKENREKVVDAVVKDMERTRAEFDSSDFDYAILLSDNSGLFDVKEKGEGTARLTSMVSLGSAFYKKSALTDAERARFNREMGEVLYASQKFSSAEQKFVTAKAAYERAGLQQDVGYLKTISSQGLLYGTMGRFTQAETSTSLALQMRREKFGEENVAVAASFNNYGVLRFNLAQYNEAESDFEKALSILKAKGLQQEMPYAILLNNQAMLFQTIGRLDEAEKTLQDAIVVAERLQNSKSKNHLKFLSNLALLYGAMGKFEAAESIYLSMEKRMGKTNPDYASMLNNQAALYMVMGKVDMVEDLLKRSAAIYKASFGEQNPAFAKSTSDLGNFYRYKEKYTDAEPLLKQALSIRELTLGKNHPLFVQSQEDIAILSWKRKEWDHAMGLYREVMDKSLDFINSYFPPMSEAEKTKYWDVLALRFQRFNNFAIDASKTHPVITQDMFDYQIATKALLLNSTNKVKQSILNSGDKQLIKDYVSWVDQKETLARLYAYSQEDLTMQKINLDSMERAANGMEKTLSTKSSAFLAGYSTQKMSFKQIKGLLTDSDAVVEIVRVRNYDHSFTKDSRYVALILTRALETPVMVVLENGEQLDTRYAKFYRNAVQQRLTDEHSYQQYWSKLEAHLTGKKVVYVSPDGAYNQINLNTLKKPGADYLISKYDIVILGNSKDLIAIKAKKPKAMKKNATLVGFPDYGKGDIAPLPATKVEVDAIGKILKASGYQVTAFSQKTATEANLKATKGPVLIHIATHGFFLRDVENSGNAFGVNIENANDNPLLRSGILLADASSTVSGKRMPNLVSNDNGVLTAYEAMNLNLEGTDLIVLSACETGLGDIKAGEGVYGLQRAFLVAGADALIMSLWKVDDSATQQLMTNFYSNWSKLGNKQKAFKQAQLQLMTKYKDPYYWGAFVMMGM